MSKLSHRHYEASRSESGSGTGFFIDNFGTILTNFHVVENANKSLVLRKTPYETPSEIYNEMYYRVRDADTDDIIIPFDTSATKLSNDSKAMYFDFYMSSLPKGKSYYFDFLIKENNFDLVVKSPSKFIIE